MYNYHYILVSGATEDEAIHEAEHLLDNFGDENNWYDIVDVIDYYDTNNQDYIKGVTGDINAYISKLNSGYEQLRELITELDKPLEEQQSFSLFILSSLAEECAELLPHYKRKAPYTIESFVDIEHIFGYRFDHFGITNYYFENHYGERLYLIKASVHS